MSSLKPTGVLLLFVLIFSHHATWAQSPGSNLNSAGTNSVGDTSKSQATPSRPQEYQVGESDVLSITVWKEPEITHSVVVRTDGYISLPLINEVKVSGMTPLQIQDLITRRLQAYLTNPQVTVTVTEIHSRRAFITGEVARPGGYLLNAETNVLQLIAQAGGLTAFAKRDNITILRFENGKQLMLPFHYREVVKGRNIGENLALRPGDTVVVP
jgi:polysaccharide export outer membrane protein